MFSSVLKYALHNLENKSFKPKYFAAAKELMRELSNFNLARLHDKVPNICPASTGIVSCGYAYNDLLAKLQPFKLICL